MDAFLSSPPPFEGPRFDQLLQQLSETSETLEGLDAWPGPQFDALAEAGVLRWSIPDQYGGVTLAAEQLMYGYERLAASCLTTTFVLTQRIGACQRIAGSENDDIRRELLPALATGEIFATVGISHLTTSRQHLKRPAVRAEYSAGTWTLSGTVPWVTGGNRADVIVTGGTCDDGQQVLIALPTDLPGVTCQTPPQLLALNASQTGAVQLEDVKVQEANLLAGPVEGVMNRGQGGGAGSVTTSALAVGLAGRAVRNLQEEAAVPGGSGRDRRVLRDRDRSASPRPLRGCPWRCRWNVRRRDPSEGELAGIAVDSGVPGGIEGGRFRCRASGGAVGARGDVLPRLVLSAAGPAGGPAGIRVFAGRLRTRFDVSVQGYRDQAVICVSCSRSWSTLSFSRRTS